MKQSCSTKVNDGESNAEEEEEYDEDEDASKRDTETEGNQETVASSTEEENIIREDEIELQVIKKKKRKECKSCGGSNHKSIYDRLCPNRIPLKLRPHTTTITVSALGRCKSPDLLPMIEDACDRVSQIMTRAMWLILTFVSQGSPALPATTEELVKASVRLVSCLQRSSTDEIPPGLEALSTELLGGVKPISTGGLSNPLLYATSQAVTMIKNFDSYENLQAHVAKYLRCKYYYMGLEKRGHAKWLARQFLKRKKIKDFSTKPKKLEGDIRLWKDIAEDELRIMKLYLYDDNVDEDDEDDEDEEEENEEEEK